MKNRSGHSDPEVFYLPGIQNSGGNSYLCDMVDLNSQELFHCPTIEKAGNRRRTRSLARSGDGSITSRRERIAKRNRILTEFWVDPMNHKVEMITILACFIALVVFLVVKVVRSRKHVA